MPRSKIVAVFCKMTVYRDSTGGDDPLWKRQPSEEALLQFARRVRRDMHLRWCTDGYFWTSRRRGVIKVIDRRMQVTDTHGTIPCDAQVELRVSLRRLQKLFTMFTRHDVPDYLVKTAKQHGLTIQLTEYDTLTRMSTGATVTASLLYT